MHPVLQREIKNLKKLAKKKDEPLSFIETHIDEVMFVSNGKKTVCVILKEDEIHNMLCCYKVDWKKWVWAQKEGFDTEEHFPEIMNEVLDQFANPEEYLSYLNLG
jgi:hypothetical protein